MNARFMLYSWFYMRMKPTRTDFVTQMYQLLFLTREVKAIRDYRQRKFSQPVFENKQTARVSLKPW